MALGHTGGARLVALVLVACVLDNAFTIHVIAPTTPKDHMCEDESLGVLDSIDPAPGTNLKDSPNPFGTVFPAQWTPKCPCNEFSNTTIKVAKFLAFHKTGTKLAVRGGQCVGAFFTRRANNKFGVLVREHCHHGCGTSKPEQPTLSVWWTRAPTDWIISGYLYHKRGDEKLKCYMNGLARSFSNVLKIRPGVAKPDLTLDLGYYSNYLQRISVEDGLFMEMFRVTHSNSVSSLPQLVTAAREGKKKGNLKVCLEDFMGSSEKYDEMWDKIIKLIAGDEVGKDHKLSNCLGKQKYAGGNGGSHSTFVSVNGTDMATMRKTILYFDKKYFNNSFARANKTIGCEELTK